MFKTYFSKERVMQMLGIECLPRVSGTTIHPACKVLYPEEDKPICSILGQCDVKHAQKHTCGDDYECESGLCYSVGGTGHGLCMASDVPTGRSCASDRQCQSGICHNFYCGDKQGIDTTCTTDFQCQCFNADHTECDGEGLCAGALCSRIGFKLAGEIAVNPRQCKSQHTSLKKCIGDEQGIDATCTTDFQCQCFNADGTECDGKGLCAKPLGAGFCSRFGYKEKGKHATD